MTRKYPRLGRIDHQYRWAKLPAHEGPRCIVCGGKAIYKVHVEFDIFRGDDEVLKACGAHSGDVPALVGAWSARGALDSGPTGSPSSYLARPDGQDLNPVSVKDLSASASPATKEQQ